MDVLVKQRWLKAEREKLGWSPSDLAKRAQPFADAEGYSVKFNQQLIWNFENTGKKVPGWFRYAVAALEAGGSPVEAERISNEDEALDEAAVLVEMLPTFAGAGGGGTGEGDARMAVFSRALVEDFLRLSAEDLLAIEIDGNSMEPAFLSGDQILIDRRKKSVAQPGAFCLWDGDGYVVKYLEKVPGSKPPSLRVISGNPIYSTNERLVEEVEIMGRVIWFGRRV
ncbi:helix-turn-helix transcriptional regulator [Sphingomonas sp. MMS24-J13]|uniref:S24 family peptidase n=1 Tax=Sphingomonas sp. MMS24-J13 TaxID=3238686 RepID=UPI00384DAB82